MISTVFLTEAIITLSVVFLSVYDVWVYAEPSPEDSISWRLRKRAIRHPFIPFALCALIGHWFGPPLDIMPAWSPGLLAAIGVGLLGVGIKIEITARRQHAQGETPMRLSWRLIAFLCVAGLICGTVLWNQGEILHETDPHTALTRP